MKREKMAVIGIIAIFMVVNFSTAVTLPIVGIGSNTNKIVITNNIDDDLALETFPDKFSWRNINGTDFTTPIKNQEPCPSCEAYALIAALETMVQYKVGYPFGCDLSEAHLFFCNGGTCKWGVEITNCTKYLKKYGVPDEGCFPDPHRKGDTPCNETLPDWQNRTVKIEDWGWVEPNLNSIKKALVQYGPLPAFIGAYSDFYFYKKGIYHHKWGLRTVWHWITIVGYDDNGGYWICKNSWGTDWGENGWFKVSYDSDIIFKSRIIYMEGVYGNLQPDVPIIEITKPQRYHTYLYDKSWKSLFGRIIIKKGEPRIIGCTSVEVNASNDIRNVEIYVDNVLRYNDTSPPYIWNWHCDNLGKHELKAIVYNARGVKSKVVTDVFTIPI